MTGTPKLFDRAALVRHRLRAAKSGPALFLHETVAAEIDERLKEVNRTFTDRVVVGGLPGPWAALGPVIPDDEKLPLAPSAHDLVVHALSLHWSDDPVGQLIQCRRALKPDGLLIAVLFGGDTLAELRTCLVRAEAEVTGGLSPRVAPMGALRDLGGLLQRAGFAMPVADSVRIGVEYRSAWQLMRDLRAMGEANALADRLRHGTRRKVLDRAAELYDSQFRTPEGRLPATFETIYLTGWAPSADQPRALRPGSATRRLSEALGATECDPETFAK